MKTARDRHFSAGYNHVMRALRDRQQVDSVEIWGLLTEAYNANNAKITETIFVRDAQLEITQTRAETVTVRGMKLAEMAGALSALTAAVNMTMAHGITYNAPDI